jgi:para-aminobenzoate synthetase/4-amino-4-deoxychorismate lyase
VRARFDFLADGQPVLFETPSDVLIARNVAQVPAVMAAADQALADGCYVAGWVAYEAAEAFDSALVTQAPGVVPLVCFGVYREKLDAPPLTSSAEPPASLAWTPDLDRAAHADGVAAIREAIADGETYQINYTFRLSSHGLKPVRSEEWSHLALAQGDVQALYSALATTERVPYAAFIETGEWAVLSLSPELFFRRDRDRLTTQPMKGTAPRGRWPAEDRARAAGLRASEKNRAENVMIVDLCRNDMSRVCDIGTVSATAMFEVVRYPTVWQMVSTVGGRVDPSVGLHDIFLALFPAGSITGAPKSSSMRLIADLEHAPRGVYCGAIGYASPDGRATFNVAIRTMTVHRPTARAEYGVGGGITWDSTAADEHAEAMQKAACLEVRPPFSLFETMRFENGAYVRLDGHLRRLRESADYFGFVFDEPAVRAALSSEAPGFSPARATRTEARVLRVRVELSANGAVSSVFSPLDTTPAAPTFTLATTPVDSSSRWLFHKTTRREVYDHHKAAHPDVWDVLLWNERHELTEFTRGNVVVELDGRKVTPPRECGLLGGVFRQELVDNGEIVEAVVTVSDLARATRIWFVNSLREWVEVRRG